MEGTYKKKRDGGMAQKQTMKVVKFPEIDKEMLPSTIVLILLICSHQYPNSARMTILRLWADIG